MPNRSHAHRPMMAGLRIRTITPSIPDIVRGGTLTGRATLRHSGNPVLVTNLHVLSGLDQMLNPPGTEEMYQSNPSFEEHLAGTNPCWVPIDPVGVNEVDLAMVSLEEEVGAEFRPHNQEHNMGMILQGTVEPWTDMEVIVFGATTGVQVGLARLHALPMRQEETGFWYFPVFKVFPGGIKFAAGDSGSPVLFEDGIGNYRMCGILMAIDDDKNGFAFPASTAERKLNAFFGDPNIILQRNDKNTGLPILTADGFAGRKLIIEEYFRAGEDLMAGDVVGVKAKSDESDTPALFRMNSGMDPHTLIGIVHTPRAKTVGELVASATDFVPVVVLGLAKARASLEVGVGDSVTHEMSSEESENHSRSRLKKATVQAEPIVGRCVSTEPANEEPQNQIINLLVDITGTAFAPSRG